MAGPVNPDIINTQIPGVVQSNGTPSPVLAAGSTGDRLPGGATGSRTSANAEDAAPAAQPAPAPGTNNQNGSPATTTAALSTPLASQATPSLSGGSSPNATQPITAQDNPLHAYGTYTYNIKIYAINKATANRISKGEITPGGEQQIIQGGKLLMSSGGAKTGDKDQYFQEDFFIENLTLGSIVNVGAMNRNTDVVEIKLDIREPYNVSFIPRLLEVANELGDAYDWTVLFFVMVINFLGYDDEGNPKSIPNTTRYIPFTFTNVEFEVDHRGSLYRCKGIPYNQLAQTPVVDRIHNNMEIEGSTVGEILGANGFANGTGLDLSTQLNNTEKYITDHKGNDLAHRYYFDIQDSSISGAKLKIPDTNNANNIPITFRQTGINNDKVKCTINKGTRITDVINTIIGVSSYMRDQFGKTANPLQVVKIVPSLEYGTYDDSVKHFQRNTTYKLGPYEILGLNTDNHFGQKPPTTESIVKTYRWLFTGKNKDILDLKLNFKVAFYNIRNVISKNPQITQGDDKGPEDTRAGSAGDRLPGGATGSVTASGPAIMKDRVVPVFDISQSIRNTIRSDEPAALAVQQLYAKMFDSVGDNVQLDLLIVGDPTLIQQDNLLYGLQSGGPRKFSNGTINWTGYSVYFNLEFRSPQKDYDDNTGLFSTSDNLAAVSWPGIYKIIGVTSEFKGGKFTQKLQNVRATFQDPPKNNNRT